MTYAAQTDNTKHLAETINKHQPFTDSKWHHQNNLLLASCSSSAAAEASHAGTLLQMYTCQCMCSCCLPGAEVVAADRGAEWLVMTSTGRDQMTELVELRCHMS